MLRTTITKCSKQLPDREQWIHMHSAHTHTYTQRLFSLTLLFQSIRRIKQFYQFEWRFCCYRFAWYKTHTSSRPYIISWKYLFFSRSMFFCFVLFLISFFPKCAAVHFGCLSGTMDQTFEMNSSEIQRKTQYALGLIRKTKNYNRNRWNKNESNWMIVNERKSVYNWNLKCIYEGFTVCVCVCASHQMILILSYSQMCRNPKFYCFPIVS